MQTLFDAIPADQREVARSALEAAFGATPVTDLRPVGGGASGALTYRAEAAGRPYFVRVETRRGPLRNPHQYVCMQTAVDAGLAPPLRYVDPERGVAVMDFLAQRPLAEYPGGPAALASALGTLAAQLQATPLFPELRDYPALLRRMLDLVRSSGTFTAGLLDPHAEGLARILEAYRWEPEARVSSHNDPNPQNVIFDGQRLWLIDWETAYRNDPLTDVAILVQSVATTPELEDVLLRAWLGRAPGPVLRARLTLMRALVRFYYAGLVLGLAAAAPRPAPDPDLTPLTQAELGAAVAQGRLKLGTPEAMHALGKMFLAAFLEAVQAPGVDDALAVARTG